LMLLVRKADLRDSYRGLLLACVFLMSITFEAYRFDDYHVLADCFELYSILLLIGVQRSQENWRTLAFSAALGLLSGLCITTRLNDGVALLLTVLIALLWLGHRQRAMCALLFCVSAGLTGALVVHLTGDSYRDYLTYSVLQAAVSKGGAGSLLRYPVQLPFQALYLTFQYLKGGASVIAILIAGVCGILLPRAWRRRTLQHVAFATIGLGLLALSWRPVSIILTSAALWLILAGPLVVAFYYLGISGIVSPATDFSRAKAMRMNRLSILMLIPFGQLASGSMSTGGTYLGLYGPLAVAILVFAISRPFQIERQWCRDFLTVMATLLIVSMACARIRDPYSWYTYRSEPLYARRVIYRGPVYGPMVINPRLLATIQPVCAQIKSGPMADELLSLPYPFANYFCATPPWHGYVQTFFDTSTPATIDALMDELRYAPPQWIFYQRQLHTLAMHERIYNGSRPLEQRHLDELIMHKIDSGEWHITFSSDLGNASPLDNHWYLIRTR